MKAFLFAITIAMFVLGSQAWSELGDSDPPAARDDKVKTTESVAKREVKMTRQDEMDKIDKEDKRIEDGAQDAAEAEQNESDTSFESRPASEFEPPASNKD